MFPFFKSVNPVFGVHQLSMKLGWLRHALFVQVRELILCLYLQMRLTLTMSANQLAWVSHSNSSIPENRERKKAIWLQNKRYMCELWHRLWQTKKACKLYITSFSFIVAITPENYNNIFWTKLSSEYNDYSIVYKWLILFTSKRRHDLTGKVAHRFNEAFKWKWKYCILASAL